MIKGATDSASFIFFPKTNRSSLQNSYCVKMLGKIKFSFSELSQLTGLAAILRFPMPELEDSDTDDNDDDLDD